MKMPYHICGARRICNYHIIGVCAARYVAVVTKIGDLDSASKGILADHLNVFQIGNSLLMSKENKRRKDAFRKAFLSEILYRPIGIFHDVVKERHDHGILILKLLCKVIGMKDIGISCLVRLSGMRLIGDIERFFYRVGIIHAALSQSKVIAESKVTAHTRDRNREKDHDHTPCFCRLQL